MKRGETSDTEPNKVDIPTDEVRDRMSLVEMGKLADHANQVLAVLRKLQDNCNPELNN